jgi:hypothetical protein
MYSWKYSNLKGSVLIIEAVFVQTKNSGSGSDPILVVFVLLPARSLC